MRHMRADEKKAADKKAEQIIFHELSKARPGYGFLGEERGLLLLVFLFSWRDRRHGFPPFGDDVRIDAMFIVPRRLPRHLANVWHG